MDPVTCSFQLELVSLSKVLIKNLPMNKATGLDKIPCRLVNLAGPFIAESLCCIFNTSISSNIFPSDWKDAKIIPIHKGNAKDDLNNYRPISILSPISKIFERLIYVTSYTVFPIMGIYRSVHPAFDDIILLLYHYIWHYNEWYANMDQGNSVVFLDLSKPFDTVNHSILINKLYAYGLCNKTVDSLTRRTQQCFINDTSHPQEWSPVVSHRAQFSVPYSFWCTLTICPIV